MLLCIVSKLEHTEGMLIEGRVCPFSYKSECAKFAQIIVTIFDRLKRKFFATINAVDSLIK